MFKDRPIGIAPLGYDAMKLLAIAIENVQSIPVGLGSREEIGRNTGFSLGID